MSTFKGVGNYGDIIIVAIESSLEGWWIFTMKATIHWALKHIPGSGLCVYIKEAKEGDISSSSSLFPRAQAHAITLDQADVSIQDSESWGTIRKTEERQNSKGHGSISNDMLARVTLRCELVRGRGHGAMPPLVPDHFLNWIGRLSIDSVSNLLSLP